MNNLRIKSPTQVCFGYSATRLDEPTVQPVRIFLGNASISYENNILTLIHELFTARFSSIKSSVFWFVRAKTRLWMKRVALMSNAVAEEGSYVKRFRRAASRPG
jgi:ABC-type uncharacterized transport system permease subunit